VPSIEMGLADTILLQRNDVPSLLDIEECMNAVEHAFCLYANGKALPPKVLGLPSGKGGFHIKAGILEWQKPKHWIFQRHLLLSMPGNAKREGTC